MPIGDVSSRLLWNGWALVQTLWVAVLMLVIGVLLGIARLPVPAVLLLAAAVLVLRYGFAVAVRIESTRVVVLHPLRRVVVTADTIRSVGVAHVPVELLPIPFLSVRAERALPALMRTSGWTDDAAFRGGIRRVLAAAGPAAVRDGDAAEVRRLLT